MVLIAYSAAGIITGAGAGHWDTMVDFLGQGQAGTGINFDDEGVAARPHLTTDNGDMQMWFSDANREFNIIGNDSGGGGVPGPNLRLIGDTLTSEPALALYQTNAVLADTHLGSLIADASNVNLYAFPAAYSLVFFTYDTSPDDVGPKLLIGPGDTATVQWWDNAWFRMFSDAGITETLSINGQTGVVNVYGSILDADVATNSVGGAANEFLNMYITTNGSYFMAADQFEWMKSTGTEIRWGVNNVDELYLSATSLGPVAVAGLSLGGVGNEFFNVYINGRIYMSPDQNEYMGPTGAAINWGVGGADELWLNASALFPNAAEGLDLGRSGEPFLNLWLGDNGFLWFGIDEDALIAWDNAGGQLYLSTDNGAAAMAPRISFVAGAAISRIQILPGAVLNVDGGAGVTGGDLQGDLRINGNKLEVYLNAAWEVVTSA